MILRLLGSIQTSYHKVEDKEEYLDASSQADKVDGNYDYLCEVVFKAILRSQAELSEAPPL